MKRLYLILLEAFFLCGSLFSQEYLRLYLHENDQPLIVAIGEISYISHDDASSQSIVMKEGTIATQISEIDSIVFLSASLSCPDDRHPHPIDLGLPSGTKWACCNIGAFEPEERGGYYAWGETEEKNNYDWATYLYGNYWNDVENIGESIAGRSYDVAHEKWGGSWKMPTVDQIRELIENCSLSCQSNEQLLDINRLTGPNGGFIFIPSAGYRYYGYLDSGGHYWSSSFYPDDESYAYSMTFDRKWFLDASGRYNGFTVRAVCP